MDDSEFVRPWDRLSAGRGLLPDAHAVALSTGGTVYEVTYLVRCGTSFLIRRNTTVALRNTSRTCAPAPGLR